MISGNGLSYNEKDLYDSFMQLSQKGGGCKCNLLSISKGLGKINKPILDHISLNLYKKKFLEFLDSNAKTTYQIKKK